MADIGERLGGDDLAISIDQPLRIIIGGPPHSGKSTFMNLLEDRFRYYQIPVELLDLDLSAPTPLKTGFTQQRDKKKWTSSLADEAKSMFEQAEGVQVVLGDSVGLISEINEIISQPADVAILLVSGGHGDYDTTYRKVVRKWKEYYEDIRKPLLVVLRSTMNPADESMFDPQDNYGVVVGMDRDAYDGNVISGHYRYDGLYPTNACLEGVVFEIAQSFDLKVRSATDPEHLDLLNQKWPDLKDKKTWTPPADSMLGGIERAYFEERGRVPADQRAESFGAEMDRKEIDTLYSYVEYLEDKCGNHYEQFIDEGLDPYRTNAESFGAESQVSKAIDYLDAFKEEMTYDKKYYTEVLIKYAKTNKKPKDLDRAINYLDGFKEEMTSDKKYYTEVLIKYAKQKKAQQIKDHNMRMRQRAIDKGWGMSYLSAEDDLSFKEWADQETMTHGQQEPFDDWLNDELSSHGDNITLQDWGQHELDSHYERYGAEDNLKALKAIYTPYIGKQVRFITKYGLDKDDMFVDIETIHSIDWDGGEDEYDEPVFLNKEGDRWMTLDYVKENLVENKAAEGMTSFEVINIEYSNSEGTASPSDYYDLPDELAVSVEETDVSATEDRIREKIESYIFRSFGEDIKVVDFTAFYTGTTDPLRGNYEDYEAEEKIHSQLMIGSLIGLGAGLWAVNRFKESREER